MRILVARRRAEALVRRLRIVAAPVNVMDVAQALKIRVVTTRLGDDISGLLITRDGAPTICVERSHALKRRRFTIAHEIGHYCLGHQFEPGEHVHVDRGALVSMRNLRSAEGTDSREVEANQFAASLLMPRFLIEDALGRQDGTVSEQEIARLAEEFQVSVQAMMIRLGALGRQ